MVLLKLFGPAHDAAHVARNCQRSCRKMSQLVRYVGLSALREYCDEVVFDGLPHWAHESEHGADRFESIGFSALEHYFCHDQAVRTDTGRLVSDDVRGLEGCTVGYGRWDQVGYSLQSVEHPSVDHVVCSVAVEVVVTRQKVVTDVSPDTKGCWSCLVIELCCVRVQVESCEFFEHPPCD